MRRARKAPVLNGFRSCTKCRKWFYVNPDDVANSGFHVSRRDKNGRVEAWQTRCRNCQNEAARKRRRRAGVRPRKPLPTEEVRRRINANRRKKRRLEKYGPLLPVEPFRQWLESKNIDHLASKMGVDQSRLRAIKRGWYVKVSSNGTRHRYPVKRVSTTFVDRALVADGADIQIWELYPG